MRLEAPTPQSRMACCRLGRLSESCGSALSCSSRIAGLVPRLVACSQISTCSDAERADRLRRRLMSSQMEDGTARPVGRGVPLAGACAGSDRGQEAEHPGDVRGRHRLLERQRLQPRHDGLPHAQHRPHREGRGDLHRRLRPAELHRRARGVHHRPVADPHRPAQGRPAGRSRGALTQRTRRSPTCSRRRATRRASSARTTWATATSSSRPSTASTSSSATSTT